MKSHAPEAHFSPLMPDVRESIGYGLEWQQKLPDSHSMISSPGANVGQIIRENAIASLRGNPLLNRAVCLRRLYLQWHLLQAGKTLQSASKPRMAGGQTSLAPPQEKRL